MATYKEEAIDAAEATSSRRAFRSEEETERYKQRLRVVIDAAEPFIREAARKEMEDRLRKALDALEVAALGAYEERLMPEDTVADRYEARKLVAVTQDYGGEYSCHWTSEGIDFIRETIKETRATLASQEVER